MAVKEIVPVPLSVAMSVMVSPGHTGCTAPGLAPRTIKTLLMLLAVAGIAADTCSRDTLAIRSAKDSLALLPR